MAYLPELVLGLASAFVIEGASPPAWAGDTEETERPGSATSYEQPVKKLGLPPLRAGVVAGVGLPRPFAAEALASFGGIVDVGLEYGFLPTVSIDSVQTDLWSLAGDLRIHPFRGAFFVGLLGGRQHLGARATLTMSGIGSANEELGLSSWFLNPRVGFLWVTRFGLAFGFDAGVQVPLATSVSSSLPLSLVPSAQSRINALGGAVLPTLDLLRVGFVL
jgi:hypothetical protein